MEEIKTISLKDKEYPKLLRAICHPPKKLFYKGELKNDEYTLAVVGTRKLSAYGREITGRIVSPLAKAGITIVSGLALGIDTLAHESTLKENGRTIAVLGSSVDEKSVYPRANAGLAQEISNKGGLVLSEYPTGSSLNRFNFPQRNTIIAGLSRGTLVIEAPFKSGALITARLALEEGRDVFAVPGPITSPNSFGPNYLIKSGAIAITEANDILEAWGLKKIEERKKEIVAESQEEEILLKFLDKNPLSLDEIAKKSGLEISKVSCCLIIMEMRGKVKSLNNKYILDD